MRDFVQSVWGQALTRYRLVAEEHIHARTAPQAMIEPLELSLVVQCDAAHAFAVFTGSTSLWWPVSHSVSRQPGLVVTFEPRTGGRIFERSLDGTEFDWG